VFRDLCIISPPVSIHKSQKMPLSIKKLTRALALACSVASFEVNAFQPNASPSFRHDTALFATANSRRHFFAGALGTAAALISSTAPASATYLAYTRREQDWQKRVDSGDVKIASAKDLKQQLREIVPMNAEGMFCPNGPSSAVSPLMENKCGDRLAIPSVFGRTQDITGNSIPGFAGGQYTANMGSESSGGMVAEVGGFPAYKK
jgi:hypothetical protein